MIDGTLTSPRFDDKYGSYSIRGIIGVDRYKRYDHNLNCTWIIKANQGFYITLDIEYLKVNNDTNDIYFDNFCDNIHYSNSSFL